MISYAENIGDRTSLRRNQTFYPSRLFSLSDFMLPTNIKEVFRFCRYLVLTDPNVSGAVHKLSESPITDVLYDHESDEVQKRYRDLFEDQLKIRERLLEGIFDLVAYSNAFLSFEVPVTRYLISPSASDGIRQDARLVNSGKLDPSVFDIKYQEQLGTRSGRIHKRYKIENINWELTGDGRFRGPCPITGKPVLFERVDRYYPTPQNVSIKRWDPNKIEIHHNEVTGKNKYYYTLAYETRQLIKMGDRDHYCEDPWEYIVAARENRNVRIRDNQLYHLSNVRISGAFNGWGIPRLYSAFKLIYYYMTLLRSNEATAIGRINDLTILFPQSQSGLMDPAAAIPGSNFRQNMMAMLKAHQRDKGFVGISPIPVGNLSVFGQGRMQLISTELEPIIRMICVALGLPYEMLYGGGHYSGSAVSQRIFSAQTGLSTERFNELLDFFKDKASMALGRDRYSPEASIKLKPAETQDDIQKKQLRVQMVNGEKLSLTTLMEDLGLDVDKEFDKMEEEAKLFNRINMLKSQGHARAQAEGQEILSRSQRSMQEAAMQDGMNPHDPMSGDPMGQDPMGGDPMGQDPMNQDPMGETPAGVDPAAGPQEEEVSDTVRQQAAMLYQYIQQYPDMQDEIIEYARQRAPQAHGLLTDALRQNAGTESDLPYLDGADYEFSPTQNNVDVGVKVDDPLPEQRPPRRSVGGL